MKYAVLSDVHANLEALKAVLRDIRNKKIPLILFLGDAVGYGPEPGECVRVLAAECSVLLAGNHDWAVLGLTNADYFNIYARMAIEWTRATMEESCLSTLKRFSLTKKISKDKIFLVHATPREPERWHYLLSLQDAEINFSCFDTRLCLLGHSHRPMIIRRLPTGQVFNYKHKTELATGRYIVNVGSVGQPRDGDPRACYAVVNDDLIALCRVQYDIEKTQSKMKEYGLPTPLIERLSRGV